MCDVNIKFIRMRIFCLLILLKLTKSQHCVDSSSRIGQCITLATCPQLIEEFFNHSSATATTQSGDLQQFISGSMCGFDGANFLICCINRGTSMISPARLRPARYQNMPPPTVAAPYNYYSYGLSPLGLFHFAPLGTSSGSINSNTPPMQYPTNPSIPPMLYPDNPQNPNTPPIIYPSNPQSPNIPPVIYPSNPQNPTTPPVVFQPTPTYYPLPPQITYATPPNTYQPLPPTRSPTQTPSVIPSASCGVSRGTTNRVVGGAEAKRGTYPWIAALGYYDEYNRNTLKFLCAGTLITTNYVLTSAHCINSNLALVRLGAHDLSNPSEPAAVDSRVKRAVIHESFNIQSIANDIALIELSSAAPSTNSIGTICLPESNNFLTQDFVGMQPFVAGWGAVKHQGPTSNVLRDVQVPIVSRQTCEQNYRTVFQFVEFSEKLICAGNSVVDACQGDSGGPLMLPQLDGNTYRYYLLGIVSYGYECARTGFPGVYTRVASYLPWIKQHLI